MLYPHENKDERVLMYRCQVGFLSFPCSLGCHAIARSQRVPSVGVACARASCHCTVNTLICGVCHYHDFLFLIGLISHPHLTAQVDGCAYIEKSTSACIYINRMAQDVDTLLLVNSDMASDPTLQHTSGRMEACPECDHDDAVFFQTLANRDVSGMRLYFVCSNRSCGHAWVSKAYGMKDPALAEVEE